MILDEDITKGFIGENGIDVYTIDMVPTKEPGHRKEEYKKDVIFTTLIDQHTYRPEKVINDIYSVFLFVTTNSGSDYISNFIYGTMEIGTIKENKRVYFKTEQIDNVKVLKLFIPI